MNEAAPLTRRRRRTGPGPEELEEASERLLTGPRRPTPASRRPVLATTPEGHTGRDPEYFTEWQQPQPQEPPVPAGDPPEDGASRHDAT